MYNLHVHVYNYTCVLGGGLLQSLSNFLPVTDNTSTEYYDPSSLASSVSQVRTDACTCT